MTKKPLSKAKLPIKKMSRSKKPQLLRGLKDILPQEQTYWDYVLESSMQTMRAYGFQRIDVPMIEEAGLYLRAMGESSPVIEHEIFTFTNETEEVIAFRPEFRSGIVRAYIEHGMVNVPKPVKVYASGPVITVEDRESGRYKQINQLDCEIIGSEQPALDAELISLTSHLCQDMGIPVMAQVNSVGCKECRPTYMSVLKEYLKDRKKNLCEDCKNKLSKNALQVFECKEEACRAISAEAPQTVDHLCDGCREHFMTVLEYLDEGDILYRLQPRLMLNAEYYTRSVFEFILQTEVEKEDPNVLGTGGRYDELVERLGGPELTAGVGIALNLERLIIALKESNVALSSSSEPDVFLTQIGETARKRSLQLFEELREAGIAVASNVSRNRLSDQLALSAKVAAKITLILGQKEMIDHTIIVRDMTDGSQETITQDKLIDTLKKRIGKK